MKTQPKKEPLLQDIHQAARSLSHAWRLFDQTCDPDDIEACIYTINAESARYTQLLKRAKKAELQCPYASFSENTEKFSDAK